MDSDRAGATARLGQNLVAARTAAHLTQQELADAAEVSRATIADIERGIADPRLSTIESLARALGTTPMMLLLEREALEVAARIGDVAASMTVSADSVRKMYDGLGAANSRGYQQAAREGVRALGVGGKAAIGAAIGSALLPGVGTIVGASLGGLLGTKVAEQIQRRIRGDDEPV